MPDPYTLAFEVLAFLVAVWLFRPFPAAASRFFLVVVLAVLGFVVDESAEAPRPFGTGLVPAALLVFACVVLVRVDLAYDRVRDLHTTSSGFASSG